MRSDRLQLNAFKTEILLCASARRRSHLPSDPLAVGSDLVSPVRCVRDLGIFIDGTADFQSLSTGPCSAATTQITLASSTRTYFVPAGSAGVGLSLLTRLCTRLLGLRSTACVTSQRTSATALFCYISAGRSTHCAFYHWRPHLLGVC